MRRTNNIPPTTNRDTPAEGAMAPEDEQVPTPIPLPHADPVGPAEGWSWAEVAGGGES